MLNSTACPSSRNLGKFLLSAIVAMALAGCGGETGPQIAPVSGVVTLDGKPLDGASVTFIPQDGRPSIAFTDATGKYELRYTNEKNGAVVGPHQVRITTAREASGGEGDQKLIEAREEMLPPHYHEKSDLTAEVKAGANTVNFELKTGTP